MKVAELQINYINLPHRKDRDEKMRAELQRAGLMAERVRGLLPHEVDAHPFDIEVMQKRTPGAIGCHFSHVSCMKSAMYACKDVMILEDDLIFCSDIQDRLKHIENFCNTHEWDVIWLGATFHKQPTWHRSRNGKHLHPDLHQCTCDLNKDWERTDDERIVRTYGAWSTYAYIVNHKSIPKILSLFDEHLHESMGIDWLFIRLAPQLKTFSFIPGCVKQYDNQSDIGNGITKFSVFEFTCGKYCWADTMQEFNPNQL